MACCIDARCIPIKVAFGDPVLASSLDSPVSWSMVGIENVQLVGQLHVEAGPPRQSALMVGDPPYFSMLLVS